MFVQDNCPQTDIISDIYIPNGGQENVDNDDFGDACDNDGILDREAYKSSNKPLLHVIGSSM